MTFIHPTAIVDSKAELDPSVEVGPHVIIEGPVRIGARTRILANAYLCGDTQIGSDNVIHMGCVIGHTPQHLGYRGAPTGVRIGNANEFREYVTIHRAAEEGHYTTIGDRCYFMGLSHVAHDVIVGNEVIVANGALLAGHVRVEDKVFISGNVGVHQFCAIGELAMIGGLSKIVKDIPPFMLVDGQSVVCGINVVGLRRAGFDAQARENIQQAYRILYRSGLSVSEAVARLASQFPECEPIQKLVSFIRNSKRGIASHTRNSGE
ncbi:MAG: acyl-ACP--UDP-N-acetylglucosamine O-acyltransferase [Candidatus Sumerlaeaceae bacterium]